MLKKTQRVKKEVFKNSDADKKPRRYSTDTVSLSVFEPNKTPVRASFVVSSKTSPSAVRRNKLKRIGYAVVKENIGKLGTKGAYVFYFKKDALTAPREKIRKDIVGLIEKAA